MMRGIRRWVAAAVMVIAGTIPAAAQAPTGWRLDLDAPATAQALEEGARARADAYWFVEMRPGWHITMGPG
ncbi:MAG TPA: hypothetical protein VLA95_11495, partial [Gemmatimonadales bacterium]|nr:hypothetical protein [Gemmatimonadales bacterium]